LIKLENAVVFHGSNLDVLPTLPDNSVDAIVTDPPYELGFMGKSWDSSGIAYSVELWQECLRVLKPGGHLLAFGGSRTWHRIAVAIEDAGFDVRDSIAWLYGSGFPKSLDISKAIDKAAGAERDKVPATGSLHKNKNLNDDSWSKIGQDNPLMDSAQPATDEAKKWQGWGTALKPAFEPIVVARKPLVGTVAANVLEWGVGGLNIDGSRIAHASADDLAKHAKGVQAMKERGGVMGDSWKNSSDLSGANDVSNAGRWPANIILDEYTAGLLDEQSGHLHGDGNKKDAGLGTDIGYSASSYQMSYQGRANRSHNDSGGASRFFYVAKASKKDRNEGLEELPDALLTGRDEGQDAMQNAYKTRSKVTKNIHPTVKPTALMEYLVKLVTPPGGTVLDPFTGSGSTGKAALLNGFKFIGIELTADYLPIIEGRLKHAAETYAAKATEEETKEQETLF
jgi:site-specific DNA-methyltransferase (adenine-specific)